MAHRRSSALFERAVHAMDCRSAHQPIRAVEPRPADRASSSSRCCCGSGACSNVDRACPFPAEIQAKLIARLRLIARAWRFVHQFARDWKAQQARKAAAQTSTPLPEPAVAHEPTSLPTATPAPVIAMPSRAPKQCDGVRARGPRSLYARTALQGLVGHPKPQPDSTSPVAELETWVPLGQTLSQKRLVHSYSQSLALSG